MAHRRVIDWYSQLVEKIEEEEKWEILRALEDEEAHKAFFADDL